MSEFVTVRELAEELGREKTVIRKYIDRHGFRLTKVRTQESRWQLTLALTKEDAEAVKALRRSQGFPVP